MKTLLNRALVAIALSVALSASAAAQVVDQTDNTAYGGTSGEFLLLGAGARGAALGGAFAALVTDVTATYHNPAGLAQLSRPGAMLSTYSYLADTRYTWIGMAFPLAGGSRAIGISGGSFGFSGQPRYTLDNPDGDGTSYSVAETFLSATLAQNFSDRFSAGLSFKFIRDELGQATAQGFAVDFGTNFHATVGERPIRAGFVIQNLGGGLQHSGAPLDVGVVRDPPLGTVDVPQEPQPAELKTTGFSIPVMFRVSVALDLLTQGMNRVTLLSEFNQPNNSKPGAGAGLEWTVSNVGNSGFSLAARGSYTINPDNDVDPGNAAGFTSSIKSGSFTSDGVALGGGINYSKGNWRFGLDYAHRSFGALGGANFVSFTLGW
jgi:hypothetical protein